MAVRGHRGSTDDDDTATRVGRVVRRGRRPGSGSGDPARRRGHRSSHRTHPRGSGRGPLRDRGTRRSRPLDRSGRRRSTSTSTALCTASSLSTSRPMYRSPMTVRCFECDGWSKPERPAHASRPQDGGRVRCHPGRGLRAVPSTPPTSVGAALTMSSNRNSAMSSPTSHGFDRYRQVGPGGEPRSPPPKGSRTNTNRSRVRGLLIGGSLLHRPPVHG